MSDALSAGPVTNVLDVIASGDVGATQDWLKKRGAAMSQPQWAEALDLALTAQMYGCFYAMWKFGSTSSTLHADHALFQQLERRADAVIPREHIARARSQQLLQDARSKQLRGDVRDAYANRFYYDEQGRLHSTDGRPAAISDDMQVWATHGCWTSIVLDGVRHEGGHEVLQQLLCDAVQKTREQQERVVQQKLLNAGRRFMQ